MADYIYLLENRLSPSQQRAIGALRTIAREHEATIFLTGGAVRDLTAGASVRDLDLTIQGDVFRLKKSLAPAGFEIVGENRDAQILFLTYMGGVRVELGAAVSVTFPRPGKPKYESSSIIEDLRSRDFTANAMAISLNEGSYGLLMDPLNGVADIENRELRLVSNYGFIEDPSRLLRAVRFMSRLGWQLEEKTRGRYETAKEDGYIANLAAWNKGYELEEIFHEEDPVRVLRALETEGWMAGVYPALSSTKSNTAALTELYNRQGELQTQGILSQTAAVAFPLVTGKMSASETATLKSMFPRQGFVQEIETLDARVKDFATKLSGKDVATPSAAWKMLHSADPNLVLATAYSSKSAPVQARLKTFLTESPSARQRIPYSLLAEMRITPDLPDYNALMDALFFELMDNKLSTPEEMKAYLEPFSPPAPPPPPNLRRARARKEAKGGRGKKKAVEIDETSDIEEMPLTVAAQEEEAGLESGLTEEGDLTGPNRGTEPTEEKPLSSVAPEPPKRDAPPPRQNKASAAKPAVAPSTSAKTDDAKAKPAKTASAEKVSGKANAAASAPAPVNAAPSAKPAAAKTPARPSKAAAAAPKKAAVESKSSRPATKVPAKAVSVKKSATSAAKKAAVKAPVKAAPTKRVSPGKKVPAKTATASKKVAARKPVVPAKKASAKKSPVKAVKTVAKKPVLAKKSAAKGKSTTAKKSSRR